MEDDPSVHPLQRFAAVGEEIAATLAKTNMASKVIRSQTCMIGWAYDWCRVRFSPRLWRRATLFRQPPGWSKSSTSFLVRSTRRQSALGHLTRSAGEGVVFKWARWSRPPYHFERGARVTMRAILADLAAHVCDTVRLLPPMLALVLTRAKVPSANAAELVLRAIHSEEDVATQNAGAALLLGKCVKSVATRRTR